MSFSRTISWATVVFFVVSVVLALQLNPSENSFVFYLQYTFISASIFVTCLSLCVLNCVAVKWFLKVLIAVLGILLLTVFLIVPTSMLMLEWALFPVFLFSLLVHLTLFIFFIHSKANLINKFFVLVTLLSFLASGCLIFIGFI